MDRATTKRLALRAGLDAARPVIAVGVHDALSAIEPSYARYTGLGLADPEASPDAAVAGASRDTLLALLAPLPDSPAKQQAIAAVAAAFAASVGPEPYDAATQAGLEAGAAAAAEILGLRTGDGSDTPHLPYTVLPGPGIYQPTPNPEFPAVITPSFAGWANVTPFALRHGSQFGVEPGAIFDLTSAAYARDYEEVRQVGETRVRGALPDSKESDIARFWPGGGSNWNLTTRLIVAGRGLDRWQHARLFALLNVAQADALIANQTWKYTYNFWRPVTAIRWPDDGNPATVSDPVWRPFLVTPPYPDYPCALPTGTAASAEVLRRFFGTDRIGFTRTYAGPPVALPAPMVYLPAKTIERRFASLSEAVAEAQDARVFAGLHLTRRVPGRRPPGHADRPLRDPARAPAVDALQAPDAVIRRATTGRRGPLGPRRPALPRRDHPSARRRVKQWRLPPRSSFCSSGATRSSASRMRSPASRIRSTRFQPALTAAVLAFLSRDGVRE